MATNLLDSSGFTERFEEILGKIRSHPLASPIAQTLVKTSDIVDLLGPVAPIIKGAIWMAAKVLDPDSVDNVKTVDHKEFKGVFQHLERVEDKLSDVHNLAKATFSLQVDARFRSGLEEIDGAYTTFLKSGSNLPEILASMENNIFPFQSSANSSFDTTKIKQYLEIVKEFQGIDSVNAAFNYVLEIRAKYLLIMSTYFGFKNNSEKVVEEFQDFNKFVEEVGLLYNSINDVAAAMQEAYKSGGEEAMREAMEKHLNQWRYQTVNFAVTGGSGAGKSSFINAIRGVRKGDAGYAETGVKETTTQVAMYDFPENPNIKVWDLPGVGTKLFPKDNYFDLIDDQLGNLQKGLTFDKFDTHMVFSATRFTENDHFIAKRVNNLGKKLIYARTKIDVDVKNNEDDDIQEEETLDTIWRDCLANLKDVKKKELFLISTKLTSKHDHRNQWDFQALYRHIFDTLSDRQKEAFLLSIQVINEEMIRQKVEVLKERIPWRKARSAACSAAFLTTCVAVYPFRVLGVASLLAAGGIAKAVGENEVAFQRQQLGLDDKSIETLAQNTGKTKEQIMEAVDMSTGSRTWEDRKIRPASEPYTMIHIGDSNLYKELDLNEKSAKLKIQLIKKLQKNKM